MSETIPETLSETLQKTYQILKKLVTIYNLCIIYP